ncbi:MAG TPA: MraY family glycosyltransferase [Patescibacteria group bacterium]|nr:MraY family glycosyltransferase [Patescibacteria group bacterium]
MLTTYISILLCGFLASFFLIFALKKILPAYRFLLSSSGIPLAGGIGIGISFLCIGLASLFIYGAFSPQSKSLIFSSFIMLIFGIFDDWREMSVGAKLAVQIFATALLVFSGVRTQIVFLSPALNTLLTFVWVIGIINALNHLDVMDGLAGTVALIVSHAFFVVSVLNKNMETAFLSLALSAGVFGFLFYNLPPARVYMGNAGSHFLGFVLAGVAVMISYASSDRKLALLTPLLIVGFPVFDTAFLIVVRMRKERSVFKKSNDHLALRFLKKGYSKNKALASMSGLALLFACAGVGLSQSPNIIGAGLVSAVLVMSAGISLAMGRVEIHG